MLETITWNYIYTIFLQNRTNHLPKIVFGAMHKKINIKIYQEVLQLKVLGYINTSSDKNPFA